MCAAVHEVHLIACSVQHLIACSVCSSSSHSACSQQLSALPAARGVSGAPLGGYEEESGGSVFGLIAGIGVIQ